MSASGPVWDDVVGQPDTIARLRAAADNGPVHAYLFVGPAGSTKLQAARAFAARLMTGGENADERDARLILRGEHPDVHEVRRVGAAISRDQADEIVRTASLSPSEGSTKVMILEEFHLLAAAGAARLLKTIEEPPDSTTFLILADFVPADLITIASRCARIDFHAIGPDVIAARLVGEGINPAAAMTAARACARRPRSGSSARHRSRAVRTARCVRRHAASTRRQRRRRHAGGGRTSRVDRRGR